MPIRLYHLTSRAAAADIVARGFDRQTCWLSPDVETICGNAASSGLVAVELDVAESELEPFARMTTEEVWDEQTGDFVPAPEWVATYVWYEVPTDLITAKGCIRMVTDQERRELTAGG